MGWRRALQASLCVTSGWQPVVAAQLAYIHAQAAPKCGTLHGASPSKLLPHIIAPQSVVSSRRSVRAACLHIKPYSYSTSLIVNASKQQPTAHHTHTPQPATATDRHNHRAHHTRPYKQEQLEHGTPAMSAAASTTQKKSCKTACPTARHLTQMLPAQQASPQPL